MHFLWEIKSIFSEPMLYTCKANHLAFLLYHFPTSVSTIGNWKILLTSLYFLWFKEECVAPFILNNSFVKQQCRKLRYWEKCLDVLTVMFFLQSKLKTKLFLTHRKRTQMSKKCINVFVQSTIFAVKLKIWTISVWLCHFCEKKMYLSGNVCDIMFDTLILTWIQHQIHNEH